ncbi:MAG: UDP-3-O-acyl-N-acetylglucosamine deacetylase, partial [Polyangiales bacterium]
MIRLEGFGLHGGRPSAILLRRAPGPTTIGCAHDRAPLAALAIVGGDRATTATLPSGAMIGSVEHMLAAIAGTRTFSGLSVDVEGDEVPLLDGCASEMVRAIEALDLPLDASPPARVVRSAELRVDDAVYSFSPSDPSSTSPREIAVAVDFPAARFGRALSGHASWMGTLASFRDEVAPARTFGARRELDELRARGLAAHVPVGAVVALDVDDE